jgi:hypothetical protein
MIRVSAMAFLAMLAIATMAFVSPAQAEGRVVLGHGRLTNNDLLGDLRDRWQTGSVASSRVVGPEWFGVLPQRPFEILEYRLAGQIITPAHLRFPEEGDRPFAGVLSLGLHTHFLRGPAEISMGVDLAATGPQTQLDELHTALHDIMGVTPISRSVKSHQIDNAVHPTLVVEAGNTIPLSGQAVLRPFVEGRAGIETMARIGADLTFGASGQGELLVRDAVTGQRYRTVKNPLAGMSYVVGGDLAYVSDSALLPSGRGYEMENTRTRLRAGVQWQGERNAVFYGLTYLSKEIDTQDEGQMLGSVRLDLKF